MDDDSAKDILKREYDRRAKIRLEIKKEKERMEKYLAEFDDLITKLARLNKPKPKFDRRF